MMYWIKKISNNNQPHYLGKKDGLGGSESNDTEEKRNESHDLQLSDGQKRDQLLQLLFLATS